MSVGTRFISASVSEATMREPGPYSPYSTRFEIDWFHVGDAAIFDQVDYRLQFVRAL